jgi:prepilin-type N-terminal cleavage/methylation domain-containing protein
MKRTAGFTLIEIMMVTAIIAILGAIAIPRFLEFQFRARSVEPRLILGIIQNAQANFYAANDCYMDVVPNPPVVPAGQAVPFDTTITNIQPCTPGAAISFQDMDIDIGSFLFYQYQCTALNPGGDVGYACDAEGDIDVDGTTSVWALCSDVDENGICDGPTAKGNVATFPYAPVRVSAERY